MQLESGVIEMQNPSQAENHWTKQEAKASARMVVNTLGDAGYVVGNDSGWLNSAETFTLFSSTSGPGLVGYLVVPNSSDAAPVTYLPFSSGVSGDSFMPVNWASNLRDRVIEALKSSIASVCQMGAEPKTITGQASIGVVQVAATWEGDDICKANKIGSQE
jgi:hypothetical protein